MFDISLLFAATGEDAMNAAQFLGLLAVILLSAKIGGAAARGIGQPTVLGELVAGMLLGVSVARLVDPHEPMLHLLAEMGVVILLFEIGLETDLNKLLKVGAASTAVAVTGVVLPFALGYAVCLLLGLTAMQAIFTGAALTATSVGITARVLSDLGRLQHKEGQIILGAAILDDVVGLVILTVVSGMVDGNEVTAWGVAQTAGIAVGFLIATLLVGRFLVQPLSLLIRRVDLPGTPTILALAMAFGLSWLASVVGSAVILGAFAAGMLHRETKQHREIEIGVAHLGHFFVPLFFVWVGAAVDLSTFNPLLADSRQTLLIGGLLLAAALVGKFAAGYAPFWMQADKRLIGVGMIPRGEVGLIFAQIGLSSGVFDAALFSAVTMMVVVTTFVAPPLLKYLAPPVEKEKPSPVEGIQDLVVGPKGG